MADQNLDSFKPLSEDEESRVTGGQGTDVCAPILRTITEIRNKIQLMEKLGQRVPHELIAQLHNFEQQYAICEAQHRHH